jgi:integrase
VFQAIYTRTENAWLRNAMALAIVTAQRREDIALAKFADLDGDVWRCIQIKTGTKLRIPLSLRLDVMGLSLADVVRQCRATNVVSRNLVHQVRPYGNSPVGAPIWKDTISKAFHAEIAALEGMDWAGKQPPTFHEIRSLSERLYAAQGNVNTQTLLGHKDPRTTAIYKDARGAEWLTVKVG